MVRVRIPVVSICADPSTHELYTVTRSKEHRVPEAIVGMLAALPPEGSVWPKAKRAEFLKVLESVLAYCYDDHGSTDPVDGDRPIVGALLKVLREMDDSTPILREWRHAIEVAVRVIREDC